MTDQMTAVQQVCPICGASVPVNDGYITWCECGWNLKAQRPEPNRLWDRVFARASRAAGERLLQSAISAQRFRPRVTVWIVIAFLLAAGVYLFALACLVLGVFVLTQVPRMWPLLLPAALLLLGLAWVCRPRLGRPPDQLLDRDRYSAVYALADRVAAALPTRAVHGIAVTGAWNASFIVAGLRRRRFISIGLPLWAAMDDRERVALLGHELAHGANSDPTRTLFIGSAIAALAEIHSVLQPTMSEEPGFGWMNIATIPMHLIFLGLARLESLYASLLAHLLWQEQRRAEFLADALGAQVAGTEAMIGVQEKFGMEDLFLSVVRAATVNRSEETAFTLLRQKLATMPERERERLRRVAEMEESRLDATHPPTAHRIRLLRSLARTRGSLRDAGPKLAAAANDALASSERRVHAEVVDRYRDALFA